MEMNYYIRELEKRHGASVSRREKVGDAKRWMGEGVKERGSFRRVESVAR